MKTYRAAVIGCSRMGGFIDNEVRADASVILPYSHAAGYTACSRTELVACADSRPDRSVMEAFGRQYNIPPERQYTDYRAMIEHERPDIVSVATQPEPRAEIVIFAAEHGVKAVYAEKAMSASLAESDAMVDAIERHSVVFNLGTNRRWDPGWDQVKAVIDSGELGALTSIVLYQTGTLFNTASHYFDLAMRLNDDRPVAWVQASLHNADHLIQDNVLLEDPAGHGIVQFDNGVTLYALHTTRGHEHEAICEHGTITAQNNGRGFILRKLGPLDPEGRRRGLLEVPFPSFKPASSTLRLIEDLVHALNTGEPPRGGPRVGRANMELIFAFIESHRRGGQRVNLPLTASALRLQRQTAPRQPNLGT
jgi:predicted dehydrogenase